MTGLRRIILLILLGAILLSPVASLTLKIGSLAPVDTPWDTALRKLGGMWKEISGGKIQLQIYPGGIAGDEANMLRLMRLGQLDGAALSGTGLNRVTSELLVMSLPMLFKGYDELAYVMENTRVMFEELVEAKGFRMIALTTAGWIRFFGKEAILFPDDLKAQKLAVSAEDSEILYTWRAMGFEAVPLHLTEILAALQSGMAEAYHTSPLISAIYQWFGLANHMSSMEMAPLIAGLIMSERAWRKVPAANREDFLAAAQAVMLPLYEEVQEMEAEVVQVMKDNGLVVDEASPESLAAWDGIITAGHEFLIGSSISPEVFDTVKRYRDEYRAAHDDR